MSTKVNNYHTKHFSAMLERERERERERGATGPSITVHTNARPCCGVGRLSSAYGRHCPSPCPARHTFLRLAVVFRLHTATQGPRAGPTSYTCPFNSPVQTRLVEFNSPFNSPVQTRLVEFNSPFNSPVQTSGWWNSTVLSTVLSKPAVGGIRGPVLTRMTR